MRRRPATAGRGLERGAAPSPTTNVNYFFFSQDTTEMTFIDTATPAGPDAYMQEVTGYNPASAASGKGGNDRTRQLSSDWATMYYQNAYNTAVMNYMNEYNSPLQQMLRYQEAGINPFLAAAENGNMSSTHPGGTPKGAFVAPSNAENARTAMQGINTLRQVLDTSQDIYDYIEYGAPSHKQQLVNLALQGDLLGYQGSLTLEKLRTAAAEANWSEYWNGSEFGAEYSPRAKYMEDSTLRMEAQIEQLQALVNVIYPSQEAANMARAALDTYKTALMKGENDAILEIDTGYPELDSVLKSSLLKLTKMFKFGKFW